MSKTKNIRTIAYQLFFYLLGISFYILALRLFFVDNKIAAGGVSGLATIINYLLGVPIGTVIFLINLPLIIFGAFVMGRNYTIKTLIGMSVYSYLLNLSNIIPVMTEDRFAASVFGGIFFGLGAVALLRAKASAGGTDLLCRILVRKFKKISLGQMFLIIDGICVIFAVIAFGDMESGVYALTAIVVFSYCTDRIISGFNKADICYIVTNLEPEKLSQHIMSELRIGVTLQEGVGMYEKTKRYILMVVIKPREIQQLKEIIEANDPNAFLVVAWASEVLGGGFKHVSDKS